MKYLKRYNESTDSDNEAIDTIRDMSLDLSDIGLSVSVSKFISHGDVSGDYGKICLRINGGTNIHYEFSNGDVYDFLTRLHNYLSDNGFEEYIISYNYREEEGELFEDERVDTMTELLSLLTKKIILTEIRLYYKRTEL